MTRTKTENLQVNEIVVKMSRDSNEKSAVALNDTSSLALLASFPNLSSRERSRVKAGLSPDGREVATAMRRLQRRNGFSLPRATAAEQVAQLYLNWAQGATVAAPAPPQTATKKH